MAMTDAQRQQRRRDKLKKQASQARFDPLPYLGQALSELAKSGKLDADLSEQLKRRALELFAQKFDSQDGPVNQTLMQRYFSNLLNLALTKQE